MVKVITLMGALVFAASVAVAAEPLLENYIRTYDYAARLEMKVSSQKLLDMLEDGKAVLVDIRFKEEQDAWGPSFALKIPLNELPERLGELPADKIIVTACPHKDRAIIAMTYLRSKGIAARYLTDGLLGLLANLRGDDAKYFLEMYKQNK
ncbi:rhodanese-like domain-containing protein [Pelobacter seleniigenes]|uniref:rhodanese-like domain-containing protein n=1 Tax=Pelobacter seleniigenes TaxID=407188 RepID=UPI0004A6E8F6|nr:rhodanese-like domain-containing protein [Pelobacter seleniigenes]